METLTQKLAGLMGDLEYNAIPDRVFAATKVSVLDHLACAYAGFHLEWSRAALELAKEAEAKAEATTWISGFRTTAPYAAFVNAVLSNSVLHEDQHLASGSHPGTMVIPVAFALGEKLGCSGKDVLTAIIAGYETVGRLGKVISAEELGKRGYRPTSVFGPFGSAVTAGKLMGLDRDGLVRALGAAGVFAGGVNEWAPAGTDDLYFQTANSAYSGILSAYLANKGLKFAPSIVEGFAGMSKAFTGIAQTSDYEFDDFNKKFEILDVYHKPVPGCAMVQTTAQLALQIANTGLDYRKIKEGTIKTSFMGKYYPGCDSIGPFKTMTQARMSNQYTFAAVLHEKVLSNDIFEIYDNPEIFALAQKLRVEVDEEANRLFPARQMVKINLVMEDGSTREFIKGDLDHYSNVQTAVTQKFRDYSARLLSRQATDDVIEAVNGLDKLDNVATLVNLMNAGR